jgi:glycosyltransferase involved in cell wall biosynthesis
MTDQPARIALVAHGAHDDGGMERAMAQLIRRAVLDYEVVVISSELAPDLEPLVEWRRVRVPRRPAPLRFLLFFALAGIRLRRVRADLVHTLGALVPNAADLATVQFCHTAYRQLTHGGGGPRRPALRRLNSALARRLGLEAERWSYGRRRIPVLAAVSRGVARELELHYPAARVVVTPNGVDIERFRPDPGVRSDLRSSEGVRSDEVVVLFVGGDWDHKGLGIAIEALARAGALGARGLRLWVVGRGDDSRFRREAEQAGVQQQVSFFGFRRDTERFFQAADIFVLPSSYETFSLVAFEAAACGLPVVATRLNGVEELIGAESAGLIVERHPEPFADALARLASDPRCRRAMGEAGRRRASAFTWERSTASVLEIYREFLGRVQPGVEAAA